MSEIPKHLSPEETLQAVREEQNTIEADLRETFLRNNFVHPYGRAGNPAEVSLLLNDFMTEKVGKNMGERFEMAISPKYFMKIHVVELGSAKAPFGKVGIDDLKHEYHDLIDWLVKHDYIQGEMSRTESERNLEVRLPSERSIAQERIVLVRIRPLVNAVSPDKKIGVGIAKRMVFSMPTLLYQGTVKAAEELAHRADLNPDAVMLQVIEAMLDRNDKRIDPIRTGYYLSTDSVEMYDDGSEDLPDLS